MKTKHATSSETAPTAPVTAPFAPAGANLKIGYFMNLLIIKVLLWAQQDLNLRPTDYESAALTV